MPQNLKAKQYPKAVESLPEPLRGMCITLRMHLEGAQNRGGRIELVDVVAALLATLELSYVLLPREASPEMKEAFVEAMAAQFGLDVDSSEISTLWAALVRVGQGGFV